MEPPTRFAWTWGIQGLPATDPRRTYVEFTLAPSGGGTRLTVVESGFAQLPDELLDTAYRGNVEGWRKELADLADYPCPACPRPDPEAVAEAVFAALAEPTRRSILGALAARGPTTATGLASQLPITRQAITKHLELLAAAGLVLAEPGERRRIRYRVNAAPMAIAQSYLAALARDWDSKLARLQRSLDTLASPPEAATHTEEL